MIPYFEQPSLAAGGLVFYAFGFCAALALLLGWWLIVRRCQVRLVSRDAAQFTARILLGGLAGSAIFFYLLRGEFGLYSFGGIASGLAIAATFARRQGLSPRQLLAYLDCVAFVFPAAWTLARFGCFLAHEHVGQPASPANWVAVAFPAGPRLDLGLIEMLFSAALAAVFLLLDRFVRPASPFFLTFFFTAYGAFRLFLDTLQLAPSFADRAFAGSSLTLGAALWLLTAFADARPVPQSSQHHHLTTPGVNA